LLPPRLREKLDSAEADGKKSSAGAWMVGLVIVAVLVAVGWWFVHGQQVKARAEVERAAARAAAVADSIARVRTADSLTTVARADSIAAFHKLPRWKQRRIIAQQARAAGGAAAAVLEEEEGPFALDMGGFLFEDRAQAEAEALKASTNLAARVTRVGADGGYHVYLGRFESRAVAEKTAGALAAKALVKQARVVPAR
jgi:hypothetical protein